MSCQASADAIRQYQSHAINACGVYDPGITGGSVRYGMSSEIYRSVANAAMSQRYAFALYRLEAELEHLKRKKTDKTTCSHCGAPVNPYRETCEYCDCYY